MDNIKLDQFRFVYFLGIGGIGMSALARWFHVNNKKVFGYDKTPSTLIESLQQAGIQVNFEDHTDAIPLEVLANPADTLVVMTPAIPTDCRQWSYFKSNGYLIKKRSEILGLIASESKTLAVAGTHGKTTTSTMLAWLLHANHLPVTAFLGGLSVNFKGNFVLSNQPADQSLVVAEADEFDRSFLRLFPDVAIVTSADADHLDIYGNEASLHKSFEDFIGQINPGGLLVIRHGLPLQIQVQTGVKVLTYGDKTADFWVENLRQEAGMQVFEVVGKNDTPETYRLQLAGLHNVENALAAIIVSKTFGLKASDLKVALENFEGVSRRFEFVLRNEQFLFIDDYAHHPKEIEAFVKGLRMVAGNKEITLVFQPHLYSRTKDFALEFSEALSLADRVYLLDIYPARELPRPGVNSGIIFKNLTCKFKKQVSKEGLLQELTAETPEVLATVGAGDIDRLVHPIRQMLLQKSDWRAAVT
jgi:UDP-N-acetylmuramate--alanine ligase